MARRFLRDRGNPGRVGLALSRPARLFLYSVQRTVQRHADLHHRDVGPSVLHGGGTGRVFESLTHEMIEAITDPFPLNISIIPPHASAPFTGEIADLCEAGQTVPNAGPIQAFTNAVGVGPSQPVAVASHWSNAQQTCLGFADNTMPSFSSSA